MSSARAVTAAACYTVLRRGADIFFVLRENTGFMDNYYSLPAGRVEVGETYLAGAIREAEEEAGVTIRPAGMVHVCTMHRFGADGSIWTDIYFEATSWEGEPYNAAPAEHSKAEWLRAEALPDHVMPFQRMALDLISEGKTYGEFKG